MTDLMQTIIDDNSNVETDGKILAISEMKLNNIYILSNRKNITTRSGTAMIASLQDYETREITPAVFILGSLIKKIDYEEDVYIVILGKKKINNYFMWDIRCKKIE